jgi:hypothetical protein
VIAGVAVGSAVLAGALIGVGVSVGLLIVRRRKQAALKHIVDNASPIHRQRSFSADQVIISADKLAALRDPSKRQVVSEEVASVGLSRERKFVGSVLPEAAISSGPVPAGHVRAMTNPVFAARHHIVARELSMVSLPFGSAGGTASASSVSSAPTNIAGLPPSAAAAPDFLSLYRNPSVNPLPRCADAMPADVETAPAEGRAQASSSEKQWAGLSGAAGTPQPTETQPQARGPRVMVRHTTVRRAVEGQSPIALKVVEKRYNF